MLRKKAEEKRKVAELAYKEKCYNCAVSCYYYHIFLRLKKFLEDKKLKIIEAPFEIESNKPKNKVPSRSHENLIYTIKDYFIKNHSKAEATVFEDVRNLKLSRTKADYYRDFCFNKKQTEFDSFKNKFNYVDTFLKSHNI